MRSDCRVPDVDVLMIVSTAWEIVMVISKIFCYEAK